MKTYIYEIVDDSGTVTHVEAMDIAEAIRYCENKLFRKVETIAVVGIGT
jgi:hypothetical protein